MKQIDSKKFHIGDKICLRDYGEDVVWEVYNILSDSKGNEKSLILSRVNPHPPEIRNIIQMSFHELESQFLKLPGE